MLYLLFIPFVVAELVLARRNRAWFWGLIPPAALTLLVVGLTIGQGLTGRAADWPIYLFIRLLPALLAFAVYGAVRLRRGWKKAVILVCMGLLFPIPLPVSDGGSTVYMAVSYRILSLHEIHTADVQDGQNGFLIGTSVEFFPSNFCRVETAFEQARVRARWEPYPSSDVRR